jgi:RND family efflux transporter MFP subunit
VIIGALLLGACGSAEEATPALDEVSDAPVRVSAAAVTRQSLVEPVFGTGTIAAHKTTDIGPRVNGTIEEIFVQVGRRVEEGDELFRTRPVDYRIRVKEAESLARLARAEAQKAERDLRRVEQLHRQGVASESRLDDVRTAHEMAAARRDQAAAAVEQARQNLADTLVRAPYRGVITRRYVDEGAMISTAGGSRPVVQLMKVDIVSAIVQIPEVHLPRVSIGTPARVRVDGTDGVYESEVYILNDRVDPDSRAFEVRLPIRNPDYKVKPGLFAEAELLPEPREAMVVERAAVLGTDGARYVFVEEDGHAVRRAVRIRELDALRLEVLAGLAPNERVLTGVNLTRVEEGTSVVVEVAHADR